MFALGAAACGAAGPYASRPADLDDARTTIRPAGDRCFPETPDRTPIALWPDPVPDEIVVGDVLATRVSGDREAACRWAEDGAAHGARLLGAEAVRVTRRAPTQHGSHWSCDVQARALRRRSDATPSRACASETLEGLDVQGDFRRPER